MPTRTRAAAFTETPAAPAQTPAAPKRKAAARPQAVAAPMPALRSRTRSRRVQVATRLEPELLERLETFVALNHTRFQDVFDAALDSYLSGMGA